MNRYKRTKNALIFWCLFIGIGAVAGAVGMLSDPSGKAMGMDAMLPYFEKLPFSDILFKDLTFSGYALLIVNGITNLTAAGLMFAKKKSGVICGTIFGFTLMLWICIQFYMFEPNFMDTAYFIFGLIQFLTGYAALVFLKQESFCFDASEYKNIGNNSKELVVYFSRMGYTKKIAYETADNSGAEVFELTTDEHTQGTSGFWWCGRFGITGMCMPLKAMPDLGKYDKITVCSPIWVFGLSAPVREFCRKANGKVKSADYIFVHFMKANFRSIADSTDGLLGVRRSGFTSLCLRMGKTVSVKEYKSKKEETV